MINVEVEVVQVLPSIEELEPSTMYELKEDSILQKKGHTTMSGQQEVWLVRLKG